MTAPNHAELILRTGDNERRYLLDDAPCGIGRDAGNAIVLEGGMVSRNHAVVQRNESGRYSVFDAGSRNGTLLNGRRVAAPTGLRDGDVLTIGEFSFVFSFSGGDGVGDKAQPQETAVLFEARDIAVVVIDIRGFTGLTRELGEKRISELISTFNREVTAIFEGFDVWGVKYIGDAVMATWDCDPRGTRRPAEAVRRVFEAIASVHAVTRDIGERFALPNGLGIGVGISAGTASLGNIGSFMTSDHTALGDVVNRAFRVESCTRQLNTDLVFGGEIRSILGESAIDSVATPHVVHLKGYPESRQVWAAPFAGIARILQLTQT